MERRGSQTRREAIDLARKLLEDIDAFERCTKHLHDPDTTPEWHREIEANWCVYHPSALEAVLDGVVSRPGFGTCPSCRAPVCFWTKTAERSYKDQSECPVCLSDTDGSILPRRHPICTACFTNLNIVPLAVYESAILGRLFQDRVQRVASAER